MPKCRVLQSGICSVTQPFHYAGQKGYNYDHMGLDLTDYNGSYNVLGWIVAHSPGTVVETRNNCTGFEYNSYGNYVTIRHDNGMYTLYAHMAYNTVQVWVGQRVTQGQVLGYMGNTGTSYGGHLHWEVRQANGTQIDPEPYLNADLPGMKNGLYYENGAWWYYINGQRAVWHTGLVQNDQGWWLVEKGTITFKHNGLAQNEYGWWRIVNSKVDFGFTGLMLGNGAWWYIKGGKVDFTCNSVEENQYGWWYVKNGKVDQTYTGIAPNKYGWWRIVKGKVDFKCNSVEQNEYGWWKCKDGKVDFNFKGIGKNKHGWWYCEGGKVDFSYNGTYTQDNYKYIYTIKNGKVVKKQRKK